MAIQLNPDQERVVGEAVQAGLVRAADEAVEIGVAAVRRLLQVRSAAGAQEAVRWSRELDAWIEGHSTSEPLLSDDAIGRNAIYGDRGL
jgi:hypothetical protein